MRSITAERYLLHRLSELQREREPRRRDPAPELLDFVRQEPAHRASDLALEEAFLGVPAERRMRPALARLRAGGPLARRPIPEEPTPPTAAGAAPRWEAPD
jgi:hypothetical protein